MSAHFRIGLVLVCLCSFALLGQDLRPDQRAKVDQLLTIERKWGPKLNTPGAELSLKRTASGGELNVYDVFTKGLPSDTTYELVRLPISGAGLEGAESMGTEMTISPKDGALLDGPDDPRTLILADYSLGEPLRMVLISKDQKYKAYLKEVPNPIQAQDKGCSFGVIRLLPKFELAAIEGTGFPPNSEIQLHSNSMGEIHDGPVKTDENGKIFTGLMPFMKDKNAGKTEVQLIAPSCKPKLSFRWGETK